MVQFYILQIKMGRMTLEDVPEHWRAAVEAAMEGGESNAEIFERPTERA